jgi:hypothetical protein
MLQQFQAPMFNPFDFNLLILSFAHPLRRPHMPLLMGLPWHHRDTHLVFDVCLTLATKIAFSLDSYVPVLFPALLIYQGHFCMTPLALLICIASFV